MSEASMNNERYAVKKDHEDLLRYFTFDLREKAVRFLLNNEKPSDDNLDELIAKYKVFIQYSYKNDLSASEMAADAKNILRNMINRELKNAKIFHEELYKLVW